MARTAGTQSSGSSSSSINQQETVMDKTVEAGLSAGNDGHVGLRMEKATTAPPAETELGDREDVEKMDVEKDAAAAAATFAIISVAALCSNPIGGAILDAQGEEYTGLQVFCGVLCLFGATGFLGARLVLAGPKLAAKV